MPSSGWKNVDATDDAAYYIRKLDEVNRLEHVRASQEVGYNLLTIAPGDRILDVGCGTGDDVKQIAQIVGETGQVIGVDFSRKLIGIAHDRAHKLPQVAYIANDAHWLSFPDSHFDGCWATRVFHHLDSPLQALSEMIRVTRSGGKVALAEGDWETLIIDAPLEPTRTILNYHCDSLRNGWIGRQLPRLFREAGLQGVAVTTATLIIDRLELAEHAFGLQKTAKQAADAGVISEEQREQWVMFLKNRESSNTFFAAVTGFTVVGTKGD